MYGRPAIRPRCRRTLCETGGPAQGEDPTNCAQGRDPLCTGSRFTVHRVAIHCAQGRDSLCTGSRSTPFWTRRSRPLPFFTHIPIGERAHRSDRNDTTIRPGSSHHHDLATPSSNHGSRPRRTSHPTSRPRRASHPASRLAASHHPLPHHDRRPPLRELPSTHAPCSRHRIPVACAAAADRDLGRASPVLWGGGKSSTHYPAKRSALQNGLPRAAAAPGGRVFTSRRGTLRARQQRRPIPVVRVPTTPRAGLCRRRNRLAPELACIVGLAAGMLLIETGRGVGPNIEDQHSGRSACTTGHHRRTSPHPAHRARDFLKGLSPMWPGDVARIRLDGGLRQVVEVVLGSLDKLHAGLRRRLGCPLWPPGGLWGRFWPSRRCWGLEGRSTLYGPF